MVWYSWAGMYPWTSRLDVGKRVLSAFYHHHVSSAHTTSFCPHFQVGVVQNGHDLCTSLED